MPSSGMAKSHEETKTTIIIMSGWVETAATRDPRPANGFGFGFAQAMIITISIPHNRLRHVSYSRDCLHTHDRL